MPSGLWRTAGLIVLVGFLNLQGLLPVVANLDHAQAATKEPRRSQTSKSKRSGTSNVTIAPTTLIPATIKNLRSAVSADSTRLVLDLDRKTPARKHFPARPNGVILEIPHATLSKSAQAKIAKGTLAKPFVITQTSAEFVTVSLPNGSFQTYKFMSLSNPPRLVIDVIPSQSQETEPSPASSDPLPSPTSPSSSPSR